MLGSIFNVIENIITQYILAVVHPQGTWQDRLQACNPLQDPKNRSPRRLDEYEILPNLTS
jgi:hypothetical protein